MKRKLLLSLLGILIGLPIWAGGHSVPGISDSVARLENRKGVLNPAKNAQFTVTYNLTGTVFNDQSYNEIVLTRDCFVNNSMPEFGVYQWQSEVSLEVQGSSSLYTVLFDSKDHSNCNIAIAGNAYAWPNDSNIFSQEVDSPSFSISIYYTIEGEKLPKLEQSMTFSVTDENGESITIDITVYTDEEDLSFNEGSFTFTSEGQTFNCTVLDEEAKTCEVTGGNVGMNLIIPEKVVNASGIEYTVVALADDAFRNWDGVSVELPATIKKVGNYCFEDAYALSSITFHQGIETFGEGSGFSNIYDRMTIPIKITVYIDDIDEWATNAPLNYGRLFQYYEGDAVYNIDVNQTLIYKGKEVKSLALGSKVEKVSPYAFAAVDLENVTFSEYLKEIGEASFAFTSIQNLELPEGLITVGDKSFMYCRDLQTVLLPSSLTYLGNEAFRNNISLYEVVIPDKVKKIGDGCFQECIDLETVQFKEGLLEIGKYSFAYCTRIKLPNFPDSLTVIGDYAFFGKLHIGDLKFGEALKSIGEFAFAVYYNVEWPEYWDGGYLLSKNPADVLTVSLPESLQSIGSGAFEWQPIREIILPAGLNYLGWAAFCGTCISEIEFPASLSVLNYRVCAYIEGLNNVSIPEGIESIGEEAFKNSPVGKLILPSTLSSIGNNAFYKSSLINCEIPEGLQSIGDEAFYESRLNNFTIPNTVTELGKNVFSNINYVKVGTGLNSINHMIAENISVLEMMSNNPPTLSSDRLGFTPDIVIVPEGAGDVYKKNNRWKDYNISARNSNKATVYVSDPGTLATEIRVQTGIMPALVTNLVVEGTINDDDFAVMRSNMTSCYEIDMSGLTNKSIPSNAFAGKTTLLELTLPSGTEEIGKEAFSGCSTLHLTGLPSTLITIGAGAFNMCSSMDLSMKFPLSLKKVGEGAFNWCSSLVSADFSGCSDLQLGTQVFSGCRSLEWANLPEGMTSLPSGTFLDAGLLSVTLPSTLETIEEGAFYGSGLQTVDIPEGVKRIENNAFRNTVSLKTVTFPSTVEYIGDCAFENSGMTSAYLPSSLSELGYGVFSNSSLSYVTFNSGISEIPAYAFAGCPYLMFVNLPNTLNAINENSFATPALAAISSPTIEPAMTFGAPFNGVDNYTCALSIPKPSYSKYLSAEYWGAFVGIRNCIDVTIPETLDVNYMDEEDYQYLLEELEEENPSERPADVRRRALRAMARDGKQDFSNLAARLFNNASLYVEDNAQIRYFIPNLPETVDDLVIKYNGKEITSQLDKETMSFVCPPLTSSSTLVIESQKLAGVETVAGEGDISMDAPVFDLTGVVVGHGPEALKNLPAGIYIVAGKKMVVK